MADDATNDEVLFEFSPLIRVHKSGKVHRLMGTDILPPGIDPATGVSSKDVTGITPETKELYARIYLPKLTADNQKLPLLVYFHGGGFVVQSPASPPYHRYLNAIAAESNVIAVSVQYRKAPEHPLPIAYEDSWAALQWVASHRDGTGPEELLNRHADFERLFLSGDSAGGNIAHNMAMKAPNPDKGVKVEILGIALMDPYFSGSDTIGEEGLVSGEKAHMCKLWPFLTRSLSVDNPVINPIAEGGRNLAGLGCQRVLVMVAEKDILKHRALLYAQYLSRSGWTGTVEIHETEGEGHVFHLYDLQTVKAKERMKLLVEFINRDLPPAV